MNTVVVKETPVYAYMTCWATGWTDDQGVIVLYAEDVRSAPIGTTWSVEDTDQYPNANRFYKVAVTKTYQDDNGALLIEHNDDDTQAIWVEFHK